MLQRPLWPGSRPEALESWHALADDLLLFVSQRGLDTVIAVGHSLGATTALRAALAEPDHFDALVLLEPVLTTRTNMLIRAITQALRINGVLRPESQAALRRRRHFRDLEQILRAYRQREVFDLLSDSQLRTIISGLTLPDDGGGHGLVFSPEWEARIYETAIWNDWDLWTRMPHLEIPTLIVRGARSDTLPPAACREVTSVNPLIELATLENASHLLPFERPSAAFEVLQQFLDHVLAAPVMPAGLHRAVA